MPTFDEIKAHDPDLIRKAQTGSLFLGPLTADLFPAEPFAYTAAVTGPPAVPASVAFIAGAFDDYTDVGLLTDDGVQFENEVTESNVTSWQSVSPTRTDIVSDIDSITAVFQETNRLAMAVYYGANLVAGSRNTGTGTVSFAKPERPTTVEYRGVAIAIDGEGDDQVIIGRSYPRLKITSRTGQQFSKGDDPITYGVTMQARYDATAGYSCRYFFGGLGWRKRLDAMGFTPLS